MAQKKSRDVIDIDEAKRWLRRYMIRLRQSFSLRERQRMSRAAISKLIRSPFYRKSKTVAAFLGFGSEIMTEALVKDAWKKGKNLLIPMTSHDFRRPYFVHFRKGDLLKKTKFGPWELIEKKEPFHFRTIDLVIVPGLAYDSSGHRLGYGGGVYDRMLEKIPRAVHVGLFFSAQKIYRVPISKHDKPLSSVVTERGIKNFH